MLFTVESTEINSTSLSVMDQVLISAISGIAGAVITLVGTFFIFFKNKKEAKIQLLFDLYLKELFPLVYKPILNEYYSYINAKHEKVPYNINFNLIESTIYNNYTLISFAPKKTQSHLLSLYAKCKSPNKKEEYEEKKRNILGLIENIKNEIEQSFEGYIDGK